MTSQIKGIFKRSSTQVQVLFKMLLEIFKVHIQYRRQMHHSPNLGLLSEAQLFNSWQPISVPISASKSQLEK